MCAQCETQVKVRPHFSGKPGLLTVFVTGYVPGRGMLQVTKVVSDPLAVDEAVTDLCLSYGFEEPR